jgi:hypothetical protein
VLELFQRQLGVRTVPDEQNSEKHSQRPERQAARNRHASPVPGGIGVWTRKCDGRAF